MWIRLLVQPFRQVNAMLEVFQSARTEAAAVVRSITATWSRATPPTEVKLPAITIRPASGVTFTVRMPSGTRVVTSGRSNPRSSAPVVSAKAARPPRASPRALLNQPAAYSLPPTRSRSPTCPFRLAEKPVTSAPVTTSIRAR